ncbi:MAG: hypothetical protein ACR2JC_16250 [Chloroflexota bacterium]
MATSNARQTWESGIERELDWWRRYLSGKGLDSHDEYRSRFDPNAPLQPHIARLRPPKSGESEYHILDCAAGPATTLGKSLEGHRLCITAVDALADRYGDLRAS